MWTSSRLLSRSPNLFSDLSFERLMPECISESCINSASLQYGLANILLRRVTTCMTNLLWAVLWNLFVSCVLNNAPNAPRQLNSACSTGVIRRSSTSLIMNVHFDLFLVGYKAFSLPYRATSWLNRSVFDSRYRSWTTNSANAVNTIGSYP